MAFYIKKKENLSNNKLQHVLTLTKSHVNVKSNIAVLYILFMK